MAFGDPEYIAEIRKTTRKELIKARRLIARGWCQGQAREQRLFGNSYCTLGALAKAAGRNYYSGKAFGAIQSEVLKQDYASGIVTWNDAPGRTQQEVLDLFDRAIEGLL